MQAQSIKLICAHYVTAKGLVLEGEGLTSPFLFPVFVLRTAPVPKYLKMHYVKEEIGDGKGVCGSRLNEKVPSMLYTDVMVLLSFSSITIYDVNMH